MNSPCWWCSSRPCRCSGVTRRVTCLLALCACLTPALAQTGCVPRPPPNPPPGPVQPACWAFCDILTTGQCPGYEGSAGEDEINGTQDDASCVDVCENLLTKGVYRATSASTGCLERATTCALAEDCLFGG